MKAPTERQDEFLAALGELAPSGRAGAGAAAVARKVGVGRAGARPQLKALLTKGLVAEVIVMKPTRTYRLTSKGWAHLRGEDDV